MKKKNIMKVVIFIVVLLIPVIYSFFYLKSYWDPYGDLTGMKIAVVNLDEGEDGKNQGKEFVQGLKDSATFDICEVSLDDANEGMQNGDYYAIISVPSNFTKCLNSAGTKDKQIATITYSPNQANNYLATQIINSAIKTMEINLQGKINSEIVGTLADKLKEIPNSLQEISDGAETILDGSKSLNAGIAQINNGTTKLNNSYTEFNNGVNSAYEGSKAVEGGLHQVNSGIGTLSTGANSLNTAISQINAGADELSSKGSNGIVALASGLTDLNQGANTLNQGVSTYVDGTTNLANGAIQYVDGATNLANGTVQYIDGTSQLVGNVAPLLTALATQGSQSTDPNMQALAAQAQQLINSNAMTTITQSGTQLKAGAAGITQSGDAIKGGANQLLASGETVKQGATKVAVGTQTILQGTSGLTGITDGITSLKTALVKVKDGTQSLESGVHALSSGTATLQSGTNNLSNGLSKLNSSSTEIKTALNTLNEGTQSAYDGSTKLVNGVETFSDEIHKGIEETKEELACLEGIEDFAEDPVEFKTEAYGEVNSYGIAFTPLFLCIGLWVGALMGYVVLYYDQKNRFGILGSNTQNKLLQNALYIGIGAVEGIVTGALLKMGLGYDIQNIGLYYIACILIGITFTSIIQFLIRNFGDIGKFFALIILVLQLAASGGTFPVETIHKAFQSINPYLPMTYAIKLLKEILVPTATNFKGQYIGILLGITIVTAMITYVVDIIKNKKERAEQK